MLTAMTEDDWAIVLQVFRAVRSRRGDKGRDDRKFLEAVHYFTVHNITWRALSAEFGHCGWLSESAQRWRSEKSWHGLCVHLSCSLQSNAWWQTMAG